MRIGEGNQATRLLHKCASMYVLQSWLNGIANEASISAYEAIIYKWVRVASRKCMRNPMRALRRANHSNLECMLHVHCLILDTCTLIKLTKASTDEFVQNLDPFDREHIQQRQMLVS